jgi:hypothetical protein
MARREFLSDRSGQSRDSTLILFRTASFEVADGIPPGGTSAALYADLLGGAWLGFRQFTFYQDSRSSGVYLVMPSPPMLPLNREYGGGFRHVRGC